MIFKEGVILDIAAPLAKALPAIDRAHADCGIGRLAVVTSANDSKHMDGSLHYKGLALDLRTRDLSEDGHGPLILALERRLKRRLNGHQSNNRPFQVVLESDHIHLEYDPE